MAVFLRPKHIQHLHHPTRHLRGYLSYEKTGHTYDFKLKKQATVPNGLFLRILWAGAYGEPFHWPFFLHPKHTDIFTIPLGIYKDTRPMKKRSRL